MASNQQIGQDRTWQLSLRFKLLVPLVAVSLVVACVVAVVSFYQGRTWAQSDVARRFQSISDTLADATYPLTANVVDSLAVLTGTELIAFDRQGSLVTSSTELSPSALQAVRQLSTQSPDDLSVVSLDQRSYLVHSLQFSQPVPRGAQRLLVLFDTQGMKQAGLRAALPPLITGLATILLLSCLFYGILSHLVRRLERLQQRVALVAAGDFDAVSNDLAGDEVGSLARAIHSMARQLKSFWQEQEQQQRARLLYQMAGGMAHQLRNTLTGARMALDLHAQQLNVGQVEEIIVARQQLEVAEQYLHRLLLVGQGQQADLKAAPVVECVDDLRRSTSAMAKHLGKQLEWSLAEQLSEARIADRMSFTAAVSNLVLNALQAAERVSVEVQLEAGSTGEPSHVSEAVLRVTVVDDGPGIDPRILDDLFEPFVTTKPEGLGLGLPTVQRAVASLGGTVVWRRENDKTIFELVCKLEP